MVISGLTGVNLSTIERRFNMASTQVAWIPSSYDLIGGALAMVIGYMGTYFHKGRIISIAALTFAVGSFIYFLPHLLAGIYEYDSGDIREDYCELDSTTNCKFLKGLLLSLLR